MGASVISRHHNRPLHAVSRDHKDSIRFLDTNAAVLAAGMIEWPRKDHAGAPGQRPIVIVNTRSELFIAFTIE